MAKLGRRDRSIGRERTSERERHKRDDDRFSDFGASV